MLHNSSPAMLATVHQYSSACMIDGVGHRFHGYQYVTNWPYKQIYFYNTQYAYIYIYVYITNSNQYSFVFCVLIMGVSKCLRRSPITWFLFYLGCQPMEFGGVFPMLHLSPHPLTHLMDNSSRQPANQLPSLKHCNESRDIHYLCRLARHCNPTACL